MVLRKSLGTMINNKVKVCCLGKRSSCRFTSRVLGALKTIPAQGWQSTHSPNFVAHGRIRTDDNNAVKCCQHSSFPLTSVILYQRASHRGNKLLPFYKGGK